MRYKHPWCAQSNAATILFLPSFERGLFYIDRVAHRNDVMSQLAVQTLAVGCYSALYVGVLPPGCLIAFAVLPAQAGFACFLDAAQLVIVVGIVGTTLPLHLALEASFFSGIWC